MTDNEIVKALECCKDDDTCPEECPYFSLEWEGGKDCLDIQDGIIPKAYDLITRQKAEIERYKGVIKILENDVKVASIEAVKGFAHYLIDRSKGGEIEVVDVADFAVEYMNRLGGKGNEQ